MELRFQFFEFRAQLNFGHPWVCWGGARGCVGRNEKTLHWWWKDSALSALNKQDRLSVRRFPPIRQLNPRAFSRVIVLQRILETRVAMSEVAPPPATATGATTQAASPNPKNRVAKEALVPDKARKARVDAVQEAQKDARQEKINEARQSAWLGFACW